MCKFFSLVKTMFLDWSHWTPLLVTKMIHISVGTKFIALTSLQNFIGWWRVINYKLLRRFLVFKGELLLYSPYTCVGQLIALVQNTWWFGIVKLFVSFINLHIWSANPKGYSQFSLFRSNSFSFLLICNHCRFFWFLFIDSDIWKNRL